MNKILLYAENDPADVVAVRKALLSSNLPFDLHIVAESKAALAYLSGKGIYSDRKRFPLPDVLLLNMPTDPRPSLEMVEWAREQRQFRNLPIIAHLNGARSADIKDTIDAGATAYFRKSADCDKLVDYLSAKMKAFAVRDACAARDRASRANA
jgi:CheY-like chemotaxis protein